MRCCENYRNSKDSAVDMTPVLKIVFIMLIFFIVTTSFVKEAGIVPSKPGVVIAVSRNSSNIIVGISEVGEVWLQKRKVDVDTVRANVKHLKVKNPEGSVIIQADKRAKMDVLVKVMDQVRLAGAASLSIAAVSND